MSEEKYEGTINSKEELPKENNDVDNLLHCPVCNSISLSVNKKGYALGKSVIGGILAGPIGLLLGGFWNAGEIKITCLKCGYEFKPGTSQHKQIDERTVEERQQDEKDKKHNIAIILFFIIIGIVIFRILDMLKLL